MSNTPICDFVRRYNQKDFLRLHMPGHKGHGPLGFENLDITEIEGADSLYEAEGIIRESEKIASGLFGADTFYSTEGSSLAIRAMLYLALMEAKHQGKAPIIAAGRNAHKTFMSAAALLDIDVKWLWPADDGSYLSCNIDAQSLERQLSEFEELPFAVYLTSPDYLGNCVDIAAVSRVCTQHDIMLLVDNAHGAYLKFFGSHPMDLGAHMCCDSAHKTLNVLTGGAYLHLNKSLPERIAASAKQALALFGSTSPSYLILQSLDAANAYLNDSYSQKLRSFCEKTLSLKAELEQAGYFLMGDEPLKITICAKKRGYSGFDLAKLMRRSAIEPEFADPDFLVLMVTPQTGEEGLEKLKTALLKVPAREPIEKEPPALTEPERVMSIREATFSPAETIPASQSLGRVLAAANVGCPPAVPIVACGESIDKKAIEAFEYYGIEYCTVVK